MTLFSLQICKLLSVTDMKSNQSLALSDEEVLGPNTAPRVLIVLQLVTCAVPLTTYKRKNNIINLFCFLIQMVNMHEYDITSVEQEDDKHCFASTKIDNNAILMTKNDVPPGPPVACSRQSTQWWQQERHFHGIMRESMLSYVLFVFTVAILGISFYFSCLYFG